MLFNRTKDRLFAEAAHTLIVKKGRAALFYLKGGRKKCVSFTGCVAVTRVYESFLGEHKPGRWHPDSPTRQR